MFKSRPAAPDKTMSDYPQLNYAAQPKHIVSQTRARLGQFLGGHYSQQNLSSLLFAHRVDSSTQGQFAGSVKLVSWSAPGRTKPTFAEAVRALARDGKTATKGQQFGPSWTNHWFRVDLKIPKSWTEYERVQFEFDGSGEAMIWTTEGLPLQGLTGGFGEDRRVEFIIPERAVKAGSYTFYVESSCNGMFGIDNMDPPDQNRFYALNSADLVVPNQDAWRLMWDFQALHGLVDVLPDDSSVRNRAMYVANEIMNVFQTGSLESVRKARVVAEQVLGKKWEDNDDRSGGTLWGVGHCHIDTAWLWPFSVTQQKVARSWSTQVDLFERYPEHRFSCTQAQQFKWLEELYPLLFDRVKAKIEDGVFRESPAPALEALLTDSLLIEPVGGTWVEMDTNMPSGEALCRQFLYGQRYFESRFGIKCPTFVLPDTFGYSSQLPQIARLAGCHNFFTQKLSWNSINNFPHSTFNWVAIDGSQILTHMTPVNNYNSQCNMDDIRRGLTGHKNLEVTAHSLLLFGNGDGGGGPTPPMLEKLRRARAIKDANPSAEIPQVRMGGSMDEFFDVVRQETAGGTKLPNWHGELYFELHRGTYTSHGSIKKGNRKNENLLRELELAATLASLYGKDYAYPKQELDASWEDLLLCQFHDVLPGSGIAMIYEDAERKYAKMRASSERLLESAHQALYPGSKALDGQIGAQDTLFAIDSLPFARREVIPVDVAAPAMLAHAAQVNANGDGRAYVIAESKAHSHSAQIARTPESVSISQSGTTFLMASSTLRLRIADGRIASLYDTVADRELLAPGQTGGFVLFEDQPANWDAWDADVYHLEKFQQLKFSQVRVAEAGPLRATLLCEAETQSSSLQDAGAAKIQVKISLDAVSTSLRSDARGMIRFDCNVDWREKHKFLKFELPTCIHSDVATYDTQFGIVTRPTHRNTSWDAAKFEVCAHKFADLSEKFGYGVALLNDCKYGYAVEGGTMRLSLLRAPTMPDADCDMGTHQFAFAIYPHVGTFAESDVHDVAYAFNNPMRREFPTQAFAR